MNHSYRSDFTQTKLANNSRHVDYVVDVAKKLADGKRPGILATVDEHGMPHLYTITSPNSAKIQHIQKKTNVSWMFSNEEMNIVLNIRGKARINCDFGKMQYVWKLLEDKSKAYFLSLATDGPGFAVIETEIEDMDCIVPKYDIKFQTHAADLQSSSALNAAPAWDQSDGSD
jgi:general stress protein 26